MHHEKTRPAFTFLQRCPQLTGHYGFAFQQFHVESKRFDLLDQHVERLWQARLEDIRPLYDAFVHPRAAVTSSDLTVRNS